MKAKKAHLGLEPVLVLVRGPSNTRLLDIAGKGGRVFVATISEVDLAARALTDEALAHPRGSHDVESRSFASSSGC